MTPTLGRPLASAIAILALSFAPSGALAATQIGHASAGIWTLITVTENNGMSFGTIRPAVAGGQVVLSTSGTISPAPGFFFAGTPTAGAFNAHGLAGFPAVVTFSTGNALTGPGAAMALGNFTNNAAANFDSAGNLNFNVGATLTINTNQAPGNYAGTYTVTVNF